MFFPLTESGQNPQMERHNFISLSSLLASETCLVREISRGYPDCVGGRDVVHHHHIHAPNGVQEIVTVQQPNARIIREERSIVALMRLESNGVRWTGLPVSGLPLRSTTVKVRPCEWMGTQQSSVPLHLFIAHEGRPIHMGSPCATDGPQRSHFARIT
jgi:hypothetical protein